MRAELSRLVIVLFYVSVGVAILTLPITLNQCFPDVINRKTVYVCISEFWDQDILLAGITLTALIGVGLSYISKHDLSMEDLLWISTISLLTPTPTWFKTSYLCFYIITAIILGLIRHHIQELARIVGILLYATSISGIIYIFLKIAGKGNGEPYIAIWRTLWLPLHSLSTPILFLLVFMVFFRLLRKNKEIPRSERASSSDLPSKLILILAITMAASLSILPYLPSINPKATPVSVDWIFYYKMLKNLEASGSFGHALLTSLKESIRNLRLLRPDHSPLMIDRVLHIYILYLVVKYTPLTAYFVAKYHNIVLLPLIPVAYYYSIVNMYKDKRLASYGAILAAVSPQFKGFLYGGFQANLTSLLAALVALSLLASSRILLRTALWISSLLTHLMTGLEYALSEIYYRALILKKLSRSSLLILSIFIILVVTLFSMANLYRGLQNPILGIKTTTFTLQIYLWGVLGDTLFYLLAIVGLWRAQIDQFYFIMLLLILLPFSTAGLQTRILLNAPIAIFAAMGFDVVRNRSKLLASGLLATMLTASAIYSIEAVW